MWMMGRLNDGNRKEDAIRLMMIIIRLRQHRFDIQLKIQIFAYVTMKLNVHPTSAWGGAC